MKIGSDYFNDYCNWEHSFFCNECGEEELERFTHNRTVANGEVWICDSCDTELVVDAEPNEDNY